jgi:hypothetical protein
MAAVGARMSMAADTRAQVAATIAPTLDGCACERSCYACLRSYGNQQEAELLNRHLAADFLRRFATAPSVEGTRVPAFSDGFTGLPRSPIERRVDQAVNALSAGSWTSYGDLAELVGTAAQPTTNHVGRDPDLAYAYRLNGDGSFSLNFAGTTTPTPATRGRS